MCFLSSFKKSRVAVSLLKLALHFLYFLHSLCTHSHSHLATILYVTIGFLFLFYLFPFLLSLFLFLPPKGTTLTSSLCLFYLPCVFFSPTFPQKRYNLCFHYPHPCRAQLLNVYLVIRFFSYSLRSRRQFSFA